MFPYIDRPKQSKQHHPTRVNMTFANIKPQKHPTTAHTIQHWNAPALRIQTFVPMSIKMTLKTALRCAECQFIAIWFLFYSNRNLHGTMGFTRFFWNGCIYLIKVRLNLSFGVSMMLCHIVHVKLKVIFSRIMTWVHYFLVEHIYIQMYLWA